MEIFVLRDSDNLYDVSAIIVSHGVTKKELEEIIAKVKQLDEYTSDDLEKTLPKDCEIWWMHYEDELYW